MKKGLVRVEARRLYHNTSKQERDKSIGVLLRILKRACNEYGINHSFKEHEFFTRKCDIRRRKRMQKRMMARQEFKLKEEQPDVEW